MATWTDNYGNTYQAPYIPNKIVGFSGIDPMLLMVNEDDASYISEQQEAAKNHATESINHEQIGGLLGGDEETGHYHLTDEEYSKLQDVLILYETGNTQHALTNEQYNMFSKTFEELYKSEQDDSQMIFDFGEVRINGEQP